MRHGRHGAQRRHARVGVVGVVGELMITVGVFLALFVVWQLWWTNVIAGREQAAVIKALEWTEPALTAGIERTDEPPAFEPVSEGALFATFLVPRFGSDYEVPVRNGTDKPTILDTGNAGHYTDTAWPGELGNFALAAHRTTYAKPFNKIADLQIGDVMIVRTDDTWFVYEMSQDPQIVKPSNVEVISPVPGTLPGEPLPELTERYITLTSCHPMFSARERYVVHGTLKYWMETSSGTPQELLDAQNGSN
jgi:sortase A